jgi:hypothetical protein
MISALVGAGGAAGVERPGLEQQGLAGARGTTGATVQALLLSQPRSGDRSG